MYLLSILILSTVFLSAKQKENQKLTPDSPQQQNIKFFLFTCDSKDKPQNISYDFNDNIIRNTKFKSNVKTKFIIHGYLNSFYPIKRIINYQEDYTVQIKNYIMNQLCPNVQVIGVDWPGGAFNINFQKVIVNTQTVVDVTIKLINKLKEIKGLNSDSIHLIGHSLGAHISGCIGANISPKIEWITGLDPAGPFFKQNDNTIRLDESDAKFVNCLHTNAGFITEGGIGLFGLADPICTIDYYVNGGSKQPGCDSISVLKHDWWSLGKTEALGLPDTCSHFRAGFLPIADLTQTDCQMIAYKCKSFEDFTSGKCADCGSDQSQCKPINFDFNYWDNYNKKNILKSKSENRFYINTQSNQPYCLYHYQIKVFISKTTESNSWFSFINTFKSNTIDLNIKGVEVSVHSPLFSSFKSGHNYTTLLTTEEDLSPINSVVVFNSVNYQNITIDKIEVNFMSHINNSVRNEKSSRLCQSEAKLLKNELNDIFVKCS